MRLCLLQLDDALAAQTAFIHACTQAEADVLDLVDCARAIRLWGTEENLAVFRQTLGNQFTGDPSEPRLTFMGSGDFHHVTVFLLGFALETRPAPVTILHLDNHPDWVKFHNGMHCGSWLHRALQHPKVEKLITLGVCSHDLRRPEWKGADLTPLSQGRLELYPYDHAPSRIRGNYGSQGSFTQKDGALYWKTIRGLGEANFTDYLLSRVQTESVYLTIDKDVLDAEDAVTNWDQGRMRISYLLSLITAVGRRYTIVGADITGDYSTPRYSGNLWTRLSKRAEIFVDQPRAQLDLAQAVNINSAANFALLEVLSEVMT